MTLFKIFLIVVLGVLAAIVILKYWREIIAIVLNVLLLVVTLVLIVVTFPIYYILSVYNYNSEEKLEKKIILQYDKIFFENASKTKREKAMRKIKSLERTLSSVQERKREKETIKMLEKCKWTL